MESDPLWPCVGSCSYTMMNCVYFFYGNREADYSICKTVILNSNSDISDDTTMFSTKIVISGELSLGWDHRRSCGARETETPPAIVLCPPTAITKILRSLPDMTALFAIYWVVLFGGLHL